MNSKLNNKGFTLVELLAVFVILLSVSLVAVVGIMESLTRRENKEIEEMKALSISGAKIYFSLLDKGSTDNCVTVGELINEGYFSTNKKDEAEKYRGYSVKLNDGYIFDNSSC